jgi:hypothetical protein
MWNAAHRRAVTLIVAAATIAGLSACTAAAPAPDDTATPRAALPDVAGEWVVTRTVTASDDSSNPAHAVGAVSQRFLLLEVDSCDATACTGTVSSGPTVDAREEGELTPSKRGFGYRIEGTLDCMDAATGGVLAVGGFAFSQEADLAIDEASGNGDASTAVSLVGTLHHTDSITSDGSADGCSRTPPTATVEYALSAVRAP